MAPGPHPPRPDLSTQRPRAVGASSDVAGAAVDGGGGVRRAFDAAVQERQGEAAGGPAPAARVAAPDLRAALAQRVDERKAAGR